MHWDVILNPSSYCITQFSQILPDIGMRSLNFVNICNESRKIVIKHLHFHQLDVHHLYRKPIHNPKALHFQRPSTVYLNGKN